MTTRRDFLQWATSAGGGALLGGPARAGSPPGGSAETPAPPPATGSDVGSLYPFIQSQAVHGEFPLSFLREHFREPADWKRQARGKLLELLHYAPPPCDPKAEVVERVDRGNYVREKVYFQTT